MGRIFNDPNFAAAQWGVEVFSLDRTQILFEHNASKLYLPASNNKVITAAAALVRLGPEYRIETGIFADGAVNGGTLKGKLVIRGGGDPSFAARFHGGDPYAVFKEWSARLKEAGIRSIEGDLVGDNAAFSSGMLGNGWQWDDLVYGYAAPVSALQFNENLVTVDVYPGSKEGDPATAKMDPDSGYFTVECRVTTGAAGSAESIEPERAESGESVLLLGTIPLKAESSRLRIAVRNPTRFFLHEFRSTLSREGVDVSRTGIREISDDSGASLRLLWTHRSATLVEILKPLLKVSQNLYAETLTRLLGLRFGDEGSFKKGREIVEETLGQMAIEKGTYVYADGSGLSRRNLISADLLVRIFKYMYRHPAFSQFYEALPIAGADGTIAGRMKGTRAENNVHAKTGTLGSVRSLSGYIRTTDGEMLAFSMIANNFLASNKSVEFVQDSAAERMANFSRR